MSDAFEESALRSLVDQLSAQVTDLTMQVTMMQNNRNDAWVNNIPTHFTPIPMMGGGGGGLHPFKVRTKKIDDKLQIFQIWLPPHIVYYNDQYLDPYDIYWTGDDYWYEIPMSDVSGVQELYLRVYKNDDDADVFDVSLNHLNGKNGIALVIALGDQETIEDEDGNKIIKSVKITQLITSAVYLGSKPRWVSPN